MNTRSLSLFSTFTEPGGCCPERLPGPLVTDGCIYIAAEIESPGCVVQKGDIFRVVYGVRDKKDERPILGKVAGDFGGVWNRRDLVRQHFQRWTAEVFFDISHGGLRSLL